MIVLKSTQNVNSNAGIFFVKQQLDRMGEFSRFDRWQKAARSAPCHRIDGYAPIFATLGTNGFQFANELRPGGQHSQRGFVPFFPRSVGMASQPTPHRLLVRLDSGHDSDDTAGTHGGKRGKPIPDARPGRRLTPPGGLSSSPNA